MLAIFLVAACGGSDLGEARFSNEQCRNVELYDVDTGDLVVGAEDIALVEMGWAFWVSAYDRLTDQPGGVYLVGVSDLTDRSVIAKNVLPGTKPHGIHSREDGEVIAIVRSDNPGDANLIAWSGTPFFELSRVDGEWVEGPPQYVQELSSGGNCSLNDLVQRSWTEELSNDRIRTHVETYATVDRENCTGAAIERILGTKSGRVIELTTRAPTVLDGLDLPNGIAFWGDDTWVAEMRAKRLIALDGERTIDLPGAPDNLNASDEGIVAALQPSLWRFGLYRYGYTDRAPTRIVLVDPETEAIELLFEDPNGRLLSGATAAVLRDEMMIASSVRGEALLVCEDGG
ncbi:MAG: hypothetical protein AAGH41_12370 [Pseudomonadota bacterium]